MLHYDLNNLLSIVFWPVIIPAAKARGKLLFLEVFQESTKFLEKSPVGFRAEHFLMTI
jgi:hypothetical protein